MTKVLIKVRVAYPKSFLKRFAIHADERRTAGETGCWSGWDREQQNSVYMILDWKSYDSAKLFWESEDAKEQIKTWESVSAEFTFLED